MNRKLTEITLFISREHVACSTVACWVILLSLKHTHQRQVQKWDNKTKDPHQFLLAQTIIERGIHKKQQQQNNSSNKTTPDTQRHPSGSVLVCSSGHVYAEKLLHSTDSAIRWQRFFSQRILLAVREACHNQLVPSSYRTLCTYRFTCVYFPSLNVSSKDSCPRLDNCSQHVTHWKQLSQSLPFETVVQSRFVQRLIFV